MNEYKELLDELRKTHGAYVMTGNKDSKTARLIWSSIEAIEALQWKIHKMLNPTVDTISELEKDA